MSKNNTEKAFIIRIPKDLWVYLKKKSAEKETSMTQLIENELEKMRKKDEKKC